MNALPMTPLVVKLGGSNARAAELDGWLSALADSGRPITIVPGGGPFADYIREAQPRLGFSDAAAHAMAILAMEQFGHLLSDRQPALKPVRGLPEVTSAMASNRTALWLPSPAALTAEDIPQSWAATSDSIAAWLCGKTGAKQLLLIKQSDAVRSADTIEHLAAAGVVDSELVSMLPMSVALHIAGPSHLPAAAAELRNGRVPGISIGRASTFKQAG